MVPVTADSQRAGRFRSRCYIRNNSRWLEPRCYHGNDIGCAAGGIHRHADEYGHVNDEGNYAGEQQTCAGRSRHGGQPGARRNHGRWLIRAAASRHAAYLAAARRCSICSTGMAPGMRCPSTKNIVGVPVIFFCLPKATVLSIDDVSQVVGAVGATPFTN